MIDDIRAYEQAGVARILLALNSGEVPAITTLMQDIAQKVIPQWR